MAWLPLESGESWAVPVSHGMGVRWGQGEGWGWERDGDGIRMGWEQRWDEGETNKGGGRDGD